MGIPPDTASKEEIIAFVTTTRWLVLGEQAGAPALIGQIMRVERASGLSPWSRGMLVITPDQLQPTDERFNGLFAKLKPFVKAYKGHRLYCSAGILLCPVETP
jgi:hypothetical protein